MKRHLLNLARKYISVENRRRIVKYTRWPPVGFGMYGNILRSKPVSSRWGEERGTPIDRYYIEKFLQQNADAIHGHVLEIAENLYTHKFGKDKVVKSDVLHPVEGRPGANIVGDLTNADHIPSDTYDCFILTQTLQFIFDTPAAVRTIYRILKPGGVVLATVPGITKISSQDMEQWGEYWHFTSVSIRKLFEAEFPSDCVQVEAYGNVLVSAAFLYGFALEEFSQRERDYRDPDYQLLITILAQKPEVPA